MLPSHNSCLTANVNGPAVNLVLCDMSVLNPNVFFELGIRTALNKPVCLIKDDKTEFIPFDLAGVNAATYASSMKKWVPDKEGAKLTEHIKASATGTGTS